MNIRNNTISNNSKFYTKEKKHYDIFFIEKINILNKINNTFINKMIKDISILINKNIYLSSYNMQIGCDNDNIKMLQSLTHFNLIELLPYKSQLYAIFSSSMLFIITDILFGGNNTHLYDINKKLDITATALFVNQKLIDFFQKNYSYAWKKFFAININFINIKKIKYLNKSDCFFQDTIIINRFLLKINKIYFCFYLLTPIFMLNSYDKKNNLFFNNNLISGEKKIKPISINNIGHVQLNITVQLMDFFLSEKNIFIFSVGDIFSIENPQKIIAYIDNIPVFLGDYTVFSKRSCIMVKKFLNITPTIEKKKNIMNNIKKTKNLENIDIKEDSNDITKKKNIIFNASVNVTVELGKTKIKIQDFLNLSQGSILILDKLHKEPLDIFMNGYLIASGEIVFLEEKYGLRITSIKDSPQSIHFTT